MKQTLSRLELSKNLEAIKNTLKTVDFDSLYNIVFYDSHSFYCYLSQFHCNNNQTVDDILKQMEDCIPFAITDESFSLFLTAANEDAADKMEALRQGFVESCKTDFLLLALQLCHSPDWENMAAACEDLRLKNRLVSQI